MPEATQSHEGILTADFGFTILDFGLYCRSYQSKIQNRIAPMMRRSVDVLGGGMRLNLHC